ncbi:MAG: response regulator [Pseudomonadota bacterium]|nr:response regulator [Pseudomonadota bacterium]
MLITFPLKVAIVDDDIIQTKLISGFLKEVPDLAPHVFNDPVEAMTAIEAGGFRLIITDLKMEALSGDDLVRRCCELRGGMQILVVTGTDHLMSAIRCFNAGAQRIIRKPIDKKELVEAVQSSVDHFKAFNETVRAIKSKKAS